MSHNPVHESTHASGPQQQVPKRKFTNLFRSTLTELKSAVEDGLLVSATDKDNPGHAPHAAPDAPVSVEEVLASSAQVDQGLQHLQGQQRQLGQHLTTILHQKPEAQQETVTHMRETMTQMEATVTTVQDAYQHLQRTVQNKRLALADKNEELRRAFEREASQHETILTLRQQNARLNRENQTLQRQLAEQKTALERLQRQHATLSQQHDALVGEHYKLYQTLHREQRAHTE